VARVFLGMGSNLGDREAYLASAIQALADQGIRPDIVSPCYETEPWGVREQPWFLNAVCSATTELGPHALLNRIKAIEVDLGRVATVRYGPRTLDIDILLYDQLVIATPRLNIPHAGLLGRASAMVPLADIAPEVVHPVSGRTIAQHLATLDDALIVKPYPASRLDATWRSLPRC